MSTSPKPMRFRPAARRVARPGRVPALVQRALVALTAVALLLGLLTSTGDPAQAAARSGYLGIDVASHQHPGGAAINWRSVRASGVRFVLVKATEGAGRAGTVSTNAYFAQDWKGAQSAGLLRGAYHYARPRMPMSTAVSDAKRFVAVIKAAGHGGGDLAPVLDLEETGGLGPKNLSEWTATWLSEVTLLTGRKPIIYSGKGFWTSYLGNTSRFAGYPFWYAHHTSAVSPAALPGGWSSWTFWQYSSKGRVAGIQTAVDLSWSCGAPGTTSTHSGCSGAAAHQKAAAQPVTKPATKRAP